MSVKTPIWKYMKDNGVQNIIIPANESYSFIASSSLYDKDREVFFRIKESQRNSIFFKNNNNHIVNDYEILFKPMSIYEDGFASMSIVNKSNKRLTLNLTAYQYFDNDDILKEAMRWERENLI